MVEAESEEKMKAITAGIAGQIQKALGVSEHCGATPVH
jgi:hypothetical protein